MSCNGAQPWPSFLNRHAFLTPLLVAFIWGINVPVMKAGLAEMHPFLFNAVRLSLSAAALGIIDWVERAGRPATKVPLKTVLWYGLLSSLVYQVLFLWGMKETTASNTALIIASGPLWAAVFSALYRLEKPTASAGISLSIAFAGTLLVTASGSAESPEMRAGPGELWGNLAILASMMTFAWTTVISKPILETVPATRLAYLSVLVSLPGHWLLALPFLGAVNPDRPAFLGFSLLFSGVLSTGVAYALWNRSVRILGPARTATFSYLVPVVALTVAWSFLDETPSPLQMTGGALVILGLASRRRPKPALPEAAPTRSR